MALAPVRLDDDVMRRFTAVKVLPQRADKINYLEFSSDGNSVLSCNTNDEIVVYNVQEAEQSKRAHSKKYGVGLVRYVDPATVVHSSTKVNNDVRYLSLYDKKYIRYFKGHENEVVSLCVSPSGDTFVSGSFNESLILWDLRSPKWLKQINVTGRPVTAFHPKGSVLAVGENSETIKLFDIRSIDQPLTTKTILQSKESDWTDLQYSPDGQTILIPTNGSLITLIDYIHCTTIHKFTCHPNENRIPIQASFSPDSLYILGALTDGIHVWNSLTGKDVCVLNSDCLGLVHNIKFNPKFIMLASISTNNMEFWVPTM